jgi:hypothetical protein
LLLVTPFFITFSLTIESINYLYNQFGDFIFPDLWIFKLLFFTIMIPISYIYKNKWLELCATHKRVF